MKRDNLELLAETCRDRKEVTKEGNNKGRCVTATILHNSHLAYDLAKQDDDIYNLLSAQEKSFQLTFSCLELIMKVNLEELHYTT